MKRLVIIPWLLALVMGATGDVRAKSPTLTPEQIRKIVETYAKSEVDNGSAIGVEVGITLGNKPPLFFSYGLARYGAPAARSGRVYRGHALPDRFCDQDLRHELARPVDHSAIFGPF